MNSTKFLALVRDWIVMAIGIFLAAHIVDGITYDSQSTLLVVVLLLSIFNIFLKPVLIILSLPFIILTFGLMLWIINAFLFMMVGWLVDGFHVDSFPSALLGALIVSVVAVIANILFDNDGSGRSSPKDPRRRSKNDDVIDI